MTPVRLLIPSCQRIVRRREGFRFCGEPSIAVQRYPDGRELFVCVECDREMRAATGFLRRT